MSIALGIEGGYGNEKPGLWTVVQYYKDFTAGWRRARMEEEQDSEEKKELVNVISPNVTLSTSNVSLLRPSRRFIALVLIASDSSSSTSCTISLSCPLERDCGDTARKFIIFTWEYSGGGTIGSCFQSRGVETIFGLFFRPLFLALQELANI